MGVRWRGPSAALVSALLLLVPSCDGGITPPPDAGSPAAPSDLRVTALGPTSARLTWQDNSDNETGFHVYRGTSGSEVTTLVATEPAGAIGCDDAGLSPGVTYYYRVHSYNGAGESRTGASGSVRTPAPPRITVSHDDLVFTATAATEDPWPQTIAITNGGDGTLSDLSVTLSYGNGGNAWLDATLSNATAPSTLTVQPTLRTLTSGSYAATITIASAVASNSPLAVAVAFQVLPRSVTSYATRDNQLSWSGSGGGVDYPIESDGNTAGCRYEYVYDGVTTYEWTLFESSCHRAALRFDVDALVTGKMIKKAVLRLVAFQVPIPPGLAPMLEVGAFAGPWDPASITWNTMPAWQTSGQARRDHPTTANTSVDFDVTTIVRAWAAGMWANHGLYLSPVSMTEPGHERCPPPSTGRASCWLFTIFQSLEYYTEVAYRPQLIVDY